MKKLILIGFFIIILTGCSLYETKEMGNESQNTNSSKNIQNIEDIEKIEGIEKIDENLYNFDDTNLEIDYKDKKIPVVYLKNGDSYTIEITKIKKEIGNAQVVMFAYNGTVPGPIIRVEKDSEVTIKVINKIKEIETTLHSHGLRLDEKFDGVPKEMGGKQDPIKYGESFTYTLKFPDEGVYWYHPHIREDFQQEMGLYGNYIVDPIKVDYWNKVNREETLILDDILIENGNIASFPKYFANYAMKGRYGNTMLINGNANYNLKAKKGEVIRIYLTNVANTRVFNFKLPGVKMKLVGGDMGKYEKETFVDEIIIAPAERYVIELYFDKEGEYEILNDNPWFKKKLGNITVINKEIEKSYKKEFEILRVNDDIISEIDNFRKYFDNTPDKYLKFSIGMKGMGGGMMGGKNKGLDNPDEDIKKNNFKDEDKIDWIETMPMNKVSSTERLEWKLIDMKTGKINMGIDDWNFKIGDKVKVRIYNDANTMHPMQHPIHFHGQRFLVIGQNGIKKDNLVWKDTVLVPTGDYIDILLDITNPGKWMAHCHIAEHLTAGMMMNFTVEK